MARDRFIRTTERRKGEIAHISERAMTGILAVAEMVKQRNLKQRDACRRLADHPLCTGIWREILLTVWLPFLEGSPNSTLTPYETRILAHELRAAAMIAGGRITPRALGGPTGWTAESVRAHHAYKARVRKAERPDWMNDPTKRLQTSDPPRSDPPRSVMNLHVHQLHAGMTLDDLRATTLKFGPKVVSGELEPIHVSVSGFDDDPRELWDIPAAIALCKRVMESGFLSVLAPNIGEDRIDGMWGSYDVWTCATGRIKTKAGRGGRVRTTPEDLQAFQDALAASNETCDTLLKGDQRIVAETPEAGRYGRN